MKVRKQLGAPAGEKAWWEEVAATLTAIADQVDEHLPDGADHPAMDRHTVDEVINRIYAARTAADTAVGAFSRLIPVERPAAPQQRPAPAVTSPPAAQSSAHAMPEGRGWGGW